MKRTGFTAILQEGELWIVGGLAAGAVFYARLLPAVPVAALFFWVTRRLVTGHWSRRNSTRYFGRPPGTAVALEPVGKQRRDNL